jgi:hypothetical protein
MNRILVAIGNANILEILEQYTQIKIYVSVNGGTTYNELTTPATRITINSYQAEYYYDDLTVYTGVPQVYYTSSFYNPVGPLESAQSAPQINSLQNTQVGFSFDNYIPPPNEWGKILTADDLRYTYMWGIDMTSSDVEQTNFQDSQLDFYIRESVGDWERLLDFDIMKHVYKTDDPILDPISKYHRSKYWRGGVDYTDEDDSYPYDPMQWQNFGFLQLRHQPIVSVERCIFKNPVGGQMMDLIAMQWIRINKKAGQLNFYPTNGAPYGPFASGVLPWRLFGGRYSNAYYVNYTTGFPTSEFVPDDLRSVIGKWAVIKIMSTVGDGLLAGFSSQSVSLDGISESFSSTQSATSAFFGARIMQMQREIKDWLDNNRSKYGKIPLSFTGF